MGDVIVISGGGSVEVGTDTLFTAVAALARAETELAAGMGEVASIERLVGPSSAGFPGFGPVMAADLEMDAALLTLARARASAAALATALHGAATAYGEAERVTQTTAEQVAAGIAYQLGVQLAPFTPLMIQLGRRLWPAILGSAGSSSGSSPWLAPIKLLVERRDSAFVVRLAVMSADEFGTGALRLPLGSDPSHRVAGDQGLSTSIAAIRDLGRTDGLLQETPIITARSSSDTAPQAIPTGWADRAGRIPDKGTTDQVRIDTYERPDGSKSYEVYIAGTRDFGLGPDDQPWDMTSNLAGIEGSEAGSIVAVENAMKESGITGDSPVLITGHSQGGLVAARIASSGEYNVKGLFTLGAPAAQSAVPAGVPWIALEHSNDIVPALSGRWAHSDPVIVTRDVGPLELARDPHFFAVHLLPEYEKTAALTDVSGDPRVGAVTRSFDDFTAGATPVLSEYYTSVRERSVTSDSPPAAR
ncbi:MAG: lipase family protein [Actinomycetota bacterium]